MCLFRESMDLTLGSNDGLDVQALRPLCLEAGGTPGTTAARQVLTGADCVGLAHGAPTHHLLGHAVLMDSCSQHRFQGGRRT